MSTKTIPPRTTATIRRERLSGLFASARRARMVLVSAPAGAGKSTLAASWFADDPSSSCWLTLGERDNDPVRFLRYCVAALRTVIPALPEPADVEGECEPWLIQVINTIAEFGSDVALFLDDYHTVESAAVHTIVETLLRHAPENFHLVIATRIDPPLGLSRLRGRGELIDVRADDLRFDVDETAALLSELGIAADESVIERVHRRTEGWGVGIRLSVSALLRRPEAERSAPGAVDDTRDFLIFIADEVLDRLDGETARLVSQLAPLGRVCAELAAAVLGAPFPSRTVERLAEQNLILDFTGPWFRFPDAIVEITTERLRGDSPGELRRIYSEAARWYRENSAPAEAAIHLIRAGEHDAAAELLEKAADDALRNADLIDAVRIASMLPENVVGRRPLLCVYVAVAEIVGAEPSEKFGSWLKTAAEADPDRAYEGERAAPAAVAFFFAGDLSRAKETAQLALRRVPDRRRLLRVLALSALAVTKIWEADVPTAATLAAEALQIGRSMGNVFVECAVYRRLLESALFAGDRESAERLFDAVRTRHVDAAGRVFPFSGFSYMTYSEILLAQNRLDEAITIANAGLELIDGWDPAVLSGPTLALARILDARGEINEAHSRFVLAVRYASEFTLTRLDERYIAAFFARFRIRTGDLDGAWSWARACGLSPDTVATGRAASTRDPIPLLGILERLTFARLILAEPGSDAGLELPRIVEPIVEPVEKHGLLPFHVEATLLLALAADRRDDPVARELVDRALLIARHPRLIRVFVELGHDVARLVYDRLATSEHREFVGEVLAAFPSDDRSAAYRSVREQGVTPLSPREVEILSLLADGLSNKELADAAYVSLATIKWHTSNIYTKLGVKSRVSAVSKARALGLITA